MKKYIAYASLALMLASPVAVMAQTTTDVPGHPRVNEVDQRLDNQQKRIDNGVASGTINAKQEARDQATDAKVSQELSKDEAKNGGKITKAEQRRMNRQLTHNSKRIHHQKATPAALTPAPVTPAAQ